jgi:hypothetical protein
VGTFFHGNLYPDPAIGAEILVYYKFTKVVDVVFNNIERSNQALPDIVDYNVSRSPPTYIVLKTKSNFPLRCIVQYSFIDQIPLAVLPIFAVQIL